MNDNWFLPGQDCPIAPGGQSCECDADCNQTLREVFRNPVREQPRTGQSLRNQSKEELVNNDGISILGGYLIPFIIFVLAIIVIAVFFLVKKYNKTGYLILGCLVVVLVVVFIVPFPAEWFFKDWNEELNPNDLMINGTWTNVYRHKDNDKVIKQISAPGVSHRDFSHVQLPTPFRYCSRGSCTIPCMLAHRVSTRFMWESLKRVKAMNSKFFPKIYSMDSDKRRYVCEKVQNELNKKTCPIDFEKQMIELNDELEKHGYYLDDVHSLNWMVDDKGQLKIVDCEVYTKQELDVQQWLLGGIDNSQDGVAQGHKNASRVLHWQDGRPNIEDVCTV